MVSLNSHKVLQICKQMQTATEVLKTNVFSVGSSCCVEVVRSVRCVHAALNHQQELHLVPAPVESMSI